MSKFYTTSASLERMRRTFRTPGKDSRPTPFYWWSGADVNMERLTWQLDQLATKGIGGTVVGYSHLPDGSIDHGDPAPLTAEWWKLFRWFVDASHSRGMTVGLQDYGILGSVLRTAGSQTKDLHGGSLRNIKMLVQGPAQFTHPVPAERLISACAWPTGHPPAHAIQIPRPDTADELVWSVPDGAWQISLVMCEQGTIAGKPSWFDPLHPKAASTVIAAFYDTIAKQLGSRLGQGFTTIFQDELDFGIAMPMWNSAVADQLTRLGFEPDLWTQALWQNLGKRTTRFRAAYRETVIDLLETNYFKPIYEWHENHGVRLHMDQLSRGDLRVGHRHYADFMRTMRWFHGPGNDDPDLTGPRNIAGFKVSSSIAHSADRPYVTNEAFHSSGWGVTPQNIVAGLNAGFAAGATKVMLHGLYYTTEGGWWEWASPDFHFRQPWWQHSEPLWNYIARCSQMLSAGHSTAEVAVLDPTADLDIIGSHVTCPEDAIELLAQLTLAGVEADLLSPADVVPANLTSGALHIGGSFYSVIVLPGPYFLPSGALQTLETFIENGGVVIALKQKPGTTEHDLIGAQELERVVTVRDINAALAVLKARVTADRRAQQGIVDVRRHIDRGFNIVFAINTSDHIAQKAYSLPSGVCVERWDAWSGEMETLVPTETRISHDAAVEISLASGESTFLCFFPNNLKCHVANEPALARHTVQRTSLSGPWNIDITPVLDNRFGDFDDPNELINVSTYQVETSAAPDGPWVPQQIGYNPRFMVLGPVAVVDVSAIEAAISAGVPIPPRTGSLPQELRWRPYSISLEHGIENDKYLLDRMAGPHGLKGVPKEFLDPHAVDEAPPPGSAYYFWSTVETSAGPEVLSMSGRCGIDVWLNGELVMTKQETAARYFAPWGLRDMSAEIVQTPVWTISGVSTVLLKVIVSADQPSRAAVALGGRIQRGNKRRLLWWSGAHPCKRFALPPTTDTSVWMKVRTPPGTVAAIMRTRSELLHAMVGNAQCQIQVIERGQGNITSRIGLPVSASQSSWLRFSTDDSEDPISPVTWELKRSQQELRPWTEWGLQDYSGSIRYTQEIALSGPLRKTRLRINDLAGAAHIIVNNEDVGDLLTNYQMLDLTSFLISGLNTITFIVTNTAVNLFRRLPSPYASMQPPGGGFLDAELITE